MIKYASNAFLATKISFINAIANVCEAVGADVRDVVLGHGLRPAHRLRVPAPGSGLRRVVLPEGHRGTAPHGRRRRLRLQPLARCHRRQRRQHGPMIDKVRATVGGDALGCAHRGAGAHVQGQHRRPPRLAGDHDRRELLDEGAVGARATTRGGRGRGRRLAGLEVVTDPYAACDGADVLAILTEWDEFRWLDFDGRRGDGRAAARRRAQPARPRRDAAARASRTRAWGADAAGSGHRRRRLPRLPPLPPRSARAGATSSPSTTSRRARPERRRPRRRSASRSSSTTMSPRAFPVEWPGRRGAALRQPGEPARIPRASARDAGRRVDRHPPRARARPRIRRPLPARVHERDLRRPARAPAAARTTGAT